ncbi:MAG: phage tail fiber protein [Gammaproteobacteria bacterium]
MNRLLKTLPLLLLPLIASATSFTDYIENKSVDHLFRDTAYSASVPASFYVGLLTAACSDSTAGTEVTGGAYARVAVARSVSAWAGTDGNTTGPSTGTDGTIDNAAIIQFPAPSGANWGVVTHFAVYDASTVGNMIICEALTTQKTINDGDAAPSFAAGALTIQVDN